MKKMLLILVSGLLLLCMAGSAMAQNAYLIDSSENQLKNPMPLSVGTPHSFGIHIYNLAASEVKTYGYTVSVSKNVNGVYQPALENEIKATLLKNSIQITNTDPISDIGVVNVEIFDAAPKNQEYKVTLIVGNNEYDQLVSASEVYTSVPEFPTVAAPVAGIVGLLFIIGRKKEGL